MIKLLKIVRVDGFNTNNLSPTMYYLKKIDSTFIPQIVSISIDLNSSDNLINSLSSL